MNEQAKVKVGDWVRFMVSGRLVIGVVSYVVPVNSCKGGADVFTDAGLIKESSILERR